MTNHEKSCLYVQILNIMANLNQFKFNITKKKSKIAVIGLGYVGLPVAYFFSKKFKVVGFDKIKKEFKV